MVSKESQSLKRVFVFASLLTLVLWPGCKRGVGDATPPGAYAYTSYDSAGTVIVRGWLTAVVSYSTKLSGEWHFEPIGNPQRIGPQTGDGKLVGGINGEKVWIELNPDVRNNNLQLNGSLVTGRLSGQWTWISYDGMANQGTFQAVRK